MFDSVTEEYRSGVPNFVTVSRENDEALAIKVIDSDGRDVFCRYERGELRSRLFSEVISSECPPWTFECPVYEALSPEVKHIARTAVEQFLSYERQR